MSPKARQEPKPILISDISSFDHEPVIAIITVGHVLSALSQVRKERFSEFRNLEQGWLRGALGPLSWACERLFVKTINEQDPEVADAVLLGSLLGSRILRLAIEDGTIEKQTCLENIKSWNIGTSGLAYSGVILDRAQLTELFSTPLADALGEIRNPVSRTICSVIVGFSLFPQSTQPE